MSDTSTWTRDNEEYLAAALAWLRLLFEVRGEPPRQITAGDEPVVAPAPPPISEARPRRRWFGRRDAPPESTPQPRSLPPARRHGRDAADVKKGIDAMREIEQGMDVPPALVILSQRFALTPFEQEVLLLCIATELDPTIAECCAGARGDARATAPTFALAFNLFDDATWKPVLPDRPLRQFSLIEVFQPPATPLTASALRADERIVSFVKGVTYLDDRLAPLLVDLDIGTGGDWRPSQAGLVERIARELAEHPPERHLPVVQLLGPDGPTKQLVAQGVAEGLGFPLYRIPAELLPRDAGELERLSRLWQRESLLVPAALFIDAAAPVHEGGPSPATRFVNRCSGPLIFIDTADVMPTFGRTSIDADVPRPSAGEQRQAWRRALESEPDAEAVAEALSGQFNLSVPAVQRIAASARTASPDVPLAERAWQSALVQTRRGLDTLAQRIDAKATWDDIVLPDAQLRLLHRIADQVAHRNRVYDDWGFADRTARGLGINALFAGPSGTGKTMAAEVIANDLRLNLYRIDLSAVVSKYIGETEKNLARLFEAAEAGGAVLFFDEADALFGKRTEIRDSHDRYANIEINYLLQRMEAYQGLAILATNMKSALDTAFVRRLRFVVDFPYPSRAERRLIWERVFPEQARVQDLDLDRLAGLGFSGGNVFTVAMNAAFLAAREGEAITMAHVLEAARAETYKLELPVNELDFVLDPAAARA